MYRGRSTCRVVDPPAAVSGLVPFGEVWLRGVVVGCCRYY